MSRDSLACGTARVPYSVFRVPCSLFYVPWACAEAAITAIFDGMARMCRRPPNTGHRTRNTGCAAPPVFAAFAAAAALSVLPPAALLGQPPPAEGEEAEEAVEEEEQEEAPTQHWGLVVRRGRESRLSLWSLARLERERFWHIGARLADAGFLGLAAEYLRAAAQSETTVPAPEGFRPVRTGTLRAGAQAQQRLAEIESSRDLPRRALARADAQLREGRPAAAYRTLLGIFRLHVPASALSHATPEAARRIADLEERAKTFQARIYEILAEGDADALAAFLEEGRREWGDFENFVGAGIAWRRITNDPRVKALQREREAAAAWEAAERAATARPGMRSLEAVQSVARRFADTEAGKKAAERLDQLRADPAFMMAVTAERARALFVQSENYRRSGMPERAAELYREYLLQYPNGADAPAARRALREVEGRE